MSATAGTPVRPTRFQKQGPATNCVIRGRPLGWLSCSAYGMAHGIDRATKGAKRPTGCDVRARTGDVTGGLTLPQVAAVAEQYGVEVELHVGSNVATPLYAMRQLSNGRGFELQGNTRALLDTSLRSTAGPVNHLVHVNEGREWAYYGGLWRPKEVLVYDSAADGRQSYAQGPDWWPYSVLLAFAATLRPWGDADSRILGPGRMYAGFLPDTEPHDHFHFRGKRTTPFPDRSRATAPAGRKVNVRSKPNHSTGKIVDHLVRGEAWHAWQVTDSGSTLAGSSRWYGDHTGTRWVHSSGLVGKGGTS